MDQTLLPAALGSFDGASCASLLFLEIRLPLRLYLCRKGQQVIISRNKPKNIHNETVGKSTPRQTANKGKGYTSRCTRQTNANVKRKTWLLTAGYDAPRSNCHVDALSNDQRDEIEKMMDVSHPYVDVPSSIVRDEIA